MGRFLLKNGEVFSGNGGVYKNILISDEKIVGVFDRDYKVNGEHEVIDCMGKIILPGLIDPHVHFRDPGYTYKEDFTSGSLSAVCGGVTTVFDMPNTNPPTISVKALNDKRKLIEGRSYANYAFYIGYDGKNIDEVNSAENIAGVKVYVANSTGNMGVLSGALEGLFEKSNKLIVVHAEDEECIFKNSEKILPSFDGYEIDPAVHSSIRSPEAAFIAVQFVCELAKKYGTRLHVAHVSTEKEVNVIEEYKSHGVTCEVTPHHLHLTEDDYREWKNFIKVNPPIRGREDVFALWKALKSGVIDIIDTDHAPHSVEEKGGKYLDVPSGIPGVEFLLPLFLNVVDSEGITIGELVRFCCENPAKVFGVKNKGYIIEGYDADLVVVDMNLEKTIDRSHVLSKAGWSPYEGLKLKGWPVMTFVNGHLVFKNGEIVSKPQGKEVVF
jgi:dihydroorotase